MPSKMPYRLALDLGSTSHGWAMIRLDADDQPCAIIKAGVRIFSDGRNPKDGSSLAVTQGNCIKFPITPAIGSDIDHWLRRQGDAS